DLAHAEHEIAAFIERYNREWLVERHDHCTPRAIRAKLEAASVSRTVNCPGNPDRYTPLALRRLRQLYRRIIQAPSLPDGHRWRSDPMPQAVRDLAADCGLTIGEPGATPSDCRTAGDAPTYSVLPRTPGVGAVPMATYAIGVRR